MKNKKVKVFLSGLAILMIVILLSGCGNNPAGSGVWDTYSGEYVQFKYPAGWVKITDEELDSDIDGTQVNIIFGKLVKDINELSNFGVTLFVNNENAPDYTEEDFYTHMSNMWFDTEEITINLEEQLIFNDYPAYHVVFTLNFEGIVVVVDSINVLKDNMIQELYYQASTDNYNESLGQEIFNSLEFKF